VLNGKVDGHTALWISCTWLLNVPFADGCRIVDNLPGATAKTEVSEGGRKLYVAGFPLGRIKVKCLPYFTASSV
jgi:hypothetical protein